MRRPTELCAACPYARSVSGEVLGTGTAFLIGVAPNAGTLADVRLHQGDSHHSTTSCFCSLYNADRPTEPLNPTTVRR